MKDKISVITTYYNSENYILQCINSVNSQIIDDSFDLEYIIIDDESKDQTSEIVDIFFDKYKNDRIIIKHIKTPENMGCGGARKFGISNATGNYLMFLDADDYYIKSDFVKRAYKLISENEADIVEFGFNYINSNGQHVQSVASKINVIKENPLRNMQAMFFDSLIMFMPWTKIIRKSLTDVKKYDVSREFEDIRTTPYWVYNATKIIIANSVEINYRFTNNSIIRDNEENTRLGTVKAIYDLFNDFKDDKKILKAMYDRCLPDLRTIIDLDSDSEYFKEMSSLNTKMLSYIYPDTYKEITYNIE